MTGISFTHPEDKDDKKEKKEIQSDKALDVTNSNMNVDEDKPSTDSEQQEEEIIPGVTVSMIKPFDKENWTQEMKDDFDRLTRHEYIDEEIETKDEIEKEKDIGLMSKETDLDETKTDKEQILIGDTGASCHMTKSMKGLINVKPINSNIVFGNGNQLKATHIGDKRGYVQQKDGTEKPIFLQKVKFVPKLTCNLFSMSAVLQNSCSMKGSRKTIELIKGKTKYLFDIKIKSGRGNLYGIRIIDQNTTDKCYLSMNDVHEMLGHPSKEIAQATAKKMKLQITDQMRQCMHCNMAKMKKKEY